MSSRDHASLAGAGSAEYYSSARYRVSNYYTRNYNRYGYY
jgi:hypothetical protein